MSFSWVPFYREVAQRVKASVISPADARYVAVYALLVAQKEHLSDVPATAPATALLYPTLNENAELQMFRS